MREFDYHRATDVREALTAGHDGARYLAGGTNLVDLMKHEVETPDRLVDVRFLALDGIEATPAGLRIGATTTNSDAAAHPEVRRRHRAVSQAVLAGASGQLRNMATVGGNLLQRTRCAYFTDRSQPCNRRSPGSGCAAIAGAHHNHAVLGASPHCVATHPSDMAVALAAFDAVVHYETLDGPGAIPLSEFYPPVDDTPRAETLDVSRHTSDLSAGETALPPGALITAVTLPPTESRSRYRKVRERASYAFATVSVAAAVDLHSGRFRIALGGVAPRPWRASVAEARLADGATFAAAAEAELRAANPLPGNGYKVALARNLITAVLTGLAEEVDR